MTFPRIDSGSVIVLDYETTGVHFWKDRAFSFAVATEDLSTWYWDIRETPRAVDWLADTLPKCKTVVAHNAKFEAHFTRELTGLRDIPWDCTMIRAALIDEHEPTYALDFLARKYCGVSKDSEIYSELAELFGGRPTRNAQMENLHRAPSGIVGRYAKQDAYATMKLYQWQQTKIGELTRIHRLERDLLHVLLDMEEGGVEVDVERAEKAVDDLTMKIGTAQRSLNDLAGFEVNPNPSGSITKLFSPKLGSDNEWYLVDGTRASKTDGGKASIDADCLRRMKHPAAKMILDLRKMLKTRDTFLKGHVLGHHSDGVVHCNFNQTKNDQDAGTGTGRLSVTNPALQQIPSRDAAIASVVRPVFLPDAGQQWLSIDWGQFEQRWFAHYVNSKDVLSRYAQDPKTDFYQVMADLTGLPRSPSYAGEPNAKQMTLASIFGMGPGKLAEEMGLPCTYEIDERTGRTWTRAGPEALEVMEKFYGAVPGIRNFLAKASSIAVSRGYVHTQLGRRIRFPGGKSTHKAGGLILQGTAADAMKMKLVEIHKMLMDTPARLLLTVHDEINISIPPHAEELISRISSCYDDFSSEKCEMNCRVPIISSAVAAENWWEASK